jgi:uncharacterized protein (DUF1499 family)
MTPPSQRGGPRAVTDVGHDDPDLRGRTYPIPFIRVWVAALALLRRPGRNLVHHDEDDGVLRAECRGSILPTRHDVTVRVSLDQDAQTRVDMEASSRSVPFDLGANRRRIRRFMAELDRAVGGAVLNRR